MSTLSNAQVDLNPYQIEAALFAFRSPLSKGAILADEVGDSQHRYEPDFVIEFKNEIVVIEVKPPGEIDTPDVQAKKKTAEKYCELVSKNVGSYGIVKPWRYVIVPTEKISITATIARLISG